MLRNRKRFLKRFIIIVTFSILILSIYFVTTYLKTQEAIFRLNESGIRYDTFTVSFDNLPSELKNEIVSGLEEIEYKEKRRFEIVEDGGDIHVFFVEKDFLYSNFLIPVGHFYWINNVADIEDEDIEILTLQGYSEAVSSALGGRAVEEVSELASALEDRGEGALGFVNFENLTKEMQVLYFQEENFLDDGLGVVEWGIGVKNISAPDFVYEIVEERIFSIEKDFEFSEIGKINMSGVTAISRALAGKIEQTGRHDYPAENIGDFLGNADIVHTSNEVSFVPGCTPSSSMSFCSDPKYIKTLETAGINIVELTGNHNNDFGAKFNAESIEMYKERGWNYYGGGLNTEDASKILYVELKNSKIAFLGYNYYDSVNNYVHNLAGDTWAGANSFSFEKMESDIQEAKKNDAIVIVTFQFTECYSYPSADVIYPHCYKPLSNPDQRKVFRTAVDYGADIVVGSQAHQPQTYEIYNGALVFYGTGNLFFDQIYWIGTRQGMVLSHYIYDGKVIQSKISTTIYDSDMRPYVTEGEQRDLLLELLKTARFE